MNTAIKIETLLSPEDLFSKLQNVEFEVGRDQKRRKWSPRPLDVDIIFMLDKNNESINHSSSTLQIPHPYWDSRNFVLSPLIHLLNTPSIVEKHRREKPLSVFAAILNVTPDSFSEKSSSLKQKLSDFQNLLALHPAVIDIGAESTRPGATPLTHEEEWQRLSPLLTYWKEVSQNFPFTKISIDTRHFETAAKSLSYNVSILNDVSGLNQPKMIEVAEDYEKTILMHSLTVPAEPQTTLPDELNAVDELKKWLDVKIKNLPQSLIPRLIFDPGIGFGKTPRQSLELLQKISEFHVYNIPLLVGHSRKSFMNLWTQQNFADRDFETLGVSAKVIHQVEYLRVHNLEAHQRLQKSILALQGPS
ncbi:dihydropteroate synthase [bacterium]|nr:dihydropteroate synthase [bacterium]